MNDDVAELLTAPTSTTVTPNYNPNFASLMQPTKLITLSPSTARNEDFNSTPQRLAGTQEDLNFSFRIKALEEQARDLLSIPASQHPVQSMLTSTKTFIQPTQFDPYFKQMKQKLDVHLKESETLKNELTRSNQFIYETDTVSKSAVSKDQNPSWVDNLVDLRMQLQEAQRANEDMKSSFRQNLTQLQASFKECLDDKEKIIGKKDEKINQLRSEVKSLKGVIDQNEHVFGDRQTMAAVNARLGSFDELCGNLRHLLETEEARREKSYFPEELSKKDKKNIADIVFKGVCKCLQDYQGEIKHSKSMMKELQHAWENKERILEDKEKSLNADFNKKCETIRVEYDRLFGVKKAEIEKLNETIDELNQQIDEQKNKHRKAMDGKDVEINSLKLNLENVKLELDESQKELQQIKSRFETLRAQEKDSKQVYSQTMDGLEKENDKLNNKVLDLNKEISDMNKQNESLRSQLVKYEQLIDNLNEQGNLLKRELKESRSSAALAKEKCDSENNERVRLESKCNQLQTELDQTRAVLSKHENCEAVLTDINEKFQQLGQNLAKKTSDLNKLFKKYEVNEAKLKAQSKTLNEVNDQKIKLDFELKQALVELGSAKSKLENSATLIQHTFTTSAIIKEEKDSTEKKLKEISLKTSALKAEYDQVLEKNSRLELRCSELESNLELANRRVQEQSRMSEIFNEEKMELINESHIVKSEVKNLQSNYKNLEKKISQITNEKDAQIQKLEQTISLYEKEINLLKQVESLHKSEEDKKAIEVASSLQAKLVEKKKQMESLKQKLATAESSLEALNKIKIKLEEEKEQINQELEVSRAKNEIWQRDFGHIEADFIELRRHINLYERELTNITERYTEAEKRNHLLRSDLIKLKTFLTSLISENEVKSGRAVSKDQDKMSSGSFISKLLNMVGSSLSTESTDSKKNLEALLESTVEEDKTIQSSELIASNKELCSKIESKFVMLNEIGNSLKKESHEVTQLLLLQKQPGKTSTKK